MAEPMIQEETHAGEPIDIHGFRLIPLARAARVQLFGLPLGLVWNRPAAIVVQSGSGQQQVLPVEDQTRKIQFTLLGIGLLGSFLIWLALGRR